uniref:Glycosyl transferase family 11 n=1 Tax=Aureoumbra lagunensis TaxID=44058 RepID=A0A7S3JMN3_9STRA
MGREGKWCCREAKRLETRFKDDVEGRRYVAQTLRLGGWMCRAFFVLDHELRGTKTQITDYRKLSAIDALCGFNATAAVLNTSSIDLKSPKRSRPVVIGVHHNGLGNTLFQYAYSRLVAWALGTSYASAMITENEGAMDHKIPPHTFEAWESFGLLFAPSDLEWRKSASRIAGDDRRGDAVCAPISPRMTGHYHGNGTFIYADRPADRRRKRPRQLLVALLARLRATTGARHHRKPPQIQLDALSDALPARQDDDLQIFTGRLRTDDDDDSTLSQQADAINNLISPRHHHRRQRYRQVDHRMLLSNKQNAKTNFEEKRTDRLRCIKFIGYFQEYALYRGLLPLVRQWLPFRLDRRITELPSTKDLVIHIRLCNAPYHVYKYFDIDNYFGPLLQRIKPRPGGSIRIITTCQAKDRGVTEELKKPPFHAIVTRPLLYDSTNSQLDKASGLAADFLYLAHATRLIICESTFSWWAAILSNATEIHAPASGMVPVAIDDPRFVFHDIVKRRYFGKPDIDHTTIAYQQFN